MTLPRRLAAAISVLAMALALVAVSAAPTTPRAGAAVDLSGQPVMGPSRVSPAQLAAFFHANTHQPYRATVPVETLAQYFVTEGNDENVRGDVAFAQSILETGWFSFPDGGFVRPSYNNFAGMGACGGCVVVQEPNAQLGVRAQIQHLRSYADPTSRVSNLHHPLVDSYGNAFNYDHFRLKGAAPTWSQMGHGNWATDPTYAVKVLGIYNRMLIFAGLPGQCPPDALGLGNSSFAYGCPVALRSPGRAVAAGANGGYYVLNGDGQVYAYNGAPYYGSSLFPFEIARDIAVMPDGQGYAVLDGWGGVHRFGSARTLLAVPNTYWKGWDIARGIAITRDGRGLAEVDGWGGVHTAGTASGIARPSTYWRNWDIARRITLSAPDNVHSTGMYVLDGWGGVHVSGTAHVFPTNAYWPGFDIARGIVADGFGRGYAVLDGLGVVHGAGIFHDWVPPQYARADRWRGLSISSAGFVATRNDGFASIGH